MSLKALLICLIILCTKLSFGQYVINQSANFNFSRSYIAVRSVPKLNFTNALKIEAWIKPTTPRDAAIVDKNYATGYSFGITNSRYLNFYKAGVVVTANTGQIPLNVWSHVAVQYIPGTVQFYLNGELIYSSSTLTGTLPSNTDSMRIGAASNGTVINGFFQGEMDDVRLWNKTYDADWDNFNMAIPLAVAAPSGMYDGLVAAYRMNGELSNIVPDEIIPVADGRPNEMVYTSYKNKVTSHNDYNNTVYFDGESGYMSHPNVLPFNSTTAITLETWFKRDMNGPQNANMSLINKSGVGNRTDYNLMLIGSALFFGINNSDRVLTYGSPAFSDGRWHHVAATYNSATGAASLYLDGEVVGQNSFGGTPLINNNADSVFLGRIGTTLGHGTEFKGELDEVRIWHNRVRTPQQIKDNMFKNIDYTTVLGPIASEAGIFGFEGKTYSSLTNLQLSAPMAAFSFRNFCAINTSRHYADGLGTSPMLRDDVNDFAGASYVISSKKTLIPDNDPAGIKDSVFISQGGMFNGIRVFTLINHKHVSDLSYLSPGSGITLTNPSGASVVLTPSQIAGEGLDLMTIFDSNADSTIKFNFQGANLNAPFSPSVKPANSFGAFSGQPVIGWWKIKFVDRVSGVLGVVNGWGIQLQTISDIGNNSGIADKYELSQNYPNPFNPATKINYQIKNNGFVSLKVFNMLGKEVASLVNVNQKAGSYSIDFNGENLSSGIYFYRLNAGEFTETKRMMLIK